MNNKIFDIIPPEKIMAEKKEENLPKKKSRFFLKGFIMLLFFFIFVILGVFFFSFKKTEIEIKPQKNSFQVVGELKLDPSADGLDLENKLIPAKLFEDEKTEEKTFSASGKTAVGEKASGIITVYNEYSSSPRVLVPSRFVSAQGKLFWSKDKITIPGYRKEGGKIIPGEKQVRVQAAEAGEDYNIEPTTFALPALAGSRLYTTVYAKSFSGMTGGQSSQTSQITEDDWESAKKTLEQDAKQAGRDSLINNLPKEYVLLEQTTIQQILEAGSSSKAGELADSFIFKSKIKSSALAVKKEDMDNFVKNLINANIKEGEKILEKSLLVTYAISQNSQESGQLALRVDVKADIYKDISVSELKKALLGRSFQEAELFLRGFSGVSEFKIKNKPFLRKNISKEEKNLDLFLNLD